jgi:hypothetical protein
MFMSLSKSLASFIALSIVATVSAPAAADESQSGTAMVHFDPRSSTPIHLERSDDQLGWQVVCDAPCDRPLPLSAEYRFDGDGVMTSWSFHLDAKPGERVTVIAEPKSTARMITGVSLAAAGLLSFSGGLLLGAAGSKSGAQEDESVVTELVLLIAGAALTVTGTVVAITGSHSGTSQESPDDRSSGFRLTDSVLPKAAHNATMFNVFKVAF